MTTQITTSIPLPKELLNTWKGSNVLIRGDQDTMIVKRILTLSKPDLKKKLRAVGKKMSVSDIGRAVLAARG